MSILTLQKITEERDQPTCWEDGNIQLVMLRGTKKVRQARFAVHITEMLVKMGHGLAWEINI